jgi:hypothetical protein
MTTATEFKLHNKLLELEELMLVAEMSSPAYPRECRHLMDVLESNKCAVTDVIKAEKALTCFWSSIQNGNFYAKNLFVAEIIGSAASSLLSVFRRYKLSKQNLFPTPDPNIEEQILWNRFTSSVREVDLMWFTLRNWDIFKPAEFLQRVYPGTYSKLGSSDIARLEYCCVPTRFDELEKMFRAPLLSKTSLVFCLNKLKVLEKLCDIYGFSGVCWRHFYGPTKIDTDVGLKIFSSLEEVKLNYMRYINLISTHAV